MSPDERDATRLWDMLDAARAAKSFTDSMTFEAYCMDRRTRNAVERNLEIIGEEAKHVSDELRQEVPEIPWSAVIGVRNIIAHEYGEILHQKVWGICCDRLGDLIETLEKLGVDRKQCD